MSAPGSLMLVAQDLVRILHLLEALLCFCEVRLVLVCSQVQLSRPCLVE